MMESRVVCGMSETTNLSYPNSSLIKEDLPTFGRPMKLILILFFILIFFISVPRVLLNPYSGLTKYS